MIPDMSCNGKKQRCPWIVPQVVQQSRHPLKDSCPYYVSSTGSTVTDGYFPSTSLVDSVNRLSSMDHNIRIRLKRHIGAYAGERGVDPYSRCKPVLDGSGIGQRMSHLPH